MAKADKGAKPDKSKSKTEAPAKGKPAKGAKPDKAKGGAGEFAKPSEATGGGDSWSLTDGDDPKSGQNNGKLFLFTPLREDVQDVTRGNKTEAVKVIVSDVVELNERKPSKSVAHSDVYIWAKWVQGSLRSFIGERMVIGRLRKEVDKSTAVGYVWKLDDFDDDDLKVAMEYRASVDPFKQ